MVLLFWCRLIQVVLGKRPLNECSVVVAVVVVMVVVVSVIMQHVGRVHLIVH